MTITIIEDNLDDLNHLSSTLLELGYYDQQKYSTFNEFSEDVKNINLQLVICDYLLDQGKTAADILALPNIPKDAKFIVCTNYFEQSVYDTISAQRPCIFLKKGFEPLELNQALDYLTKSNIKIQSNQKIIHDNFFIKLGDKYKSINIDDVLYFEIDGKYVNVVCSERTYAIRSTLTDLEYRLSKKFVRTHSAFIVNISKIVNFKPSENVVELSNGKEIPFTRKYKTNLLDAIILT